MKKIMNIVAITGEYEKNGEKKKEYTNVVKLLVKDDGKISVKINNIPLNRDGRANVYEIEKKEKQSNFNEGTPF